MSLQATIERVGPPVQRDGLVRQGGTLQIVRKFSRMLATLQLTADGRTGPYEVITDAVTR